MRNLSQLLTFILLTPVISLMIWLFTSHQWVAYVNVLFYVSMILSIVTFILILIQEGVFDATSYGMRRMKYRLSSKSIKLQFKMTTSSIRNKRRNHIIKWRVGSKSRSLLM
ncbi:DUF3899 domain-containing protein [Staphylococcus pettenkoferi]|uniref:DUF3899 domain-containing protein n=2 Tax=Staphylococcus pettenkoferi TaxID=170573 RepID=A0ABT4BLL7_9STAP|nr:DUF3899 domain-containing protein [Staphylococcus pettenkoferi]